MTHIAGECFFFNLHLTQMKFGLFGKTHVSDKKIIITKSTENEYFLDFRSSHVHNLFRQLHRKTTVLELIFIVKFVKILRTPIFEEHLRMTDCFSDLKYGIVFFFFFFFYILNNSTANSEVCIKVRTMSIILNVFQ